MPEPRPGRFLRRGERAGIGAAGVSPPLVVAVTHADRPRCPAALRDAAGIAAEHRVSGIEHQDAGPELRAHRGHQLSQQAGRSPVLPAICGSGPLTGCPPVVEDGRGDADRDAAADAAGVQVNRHSCPRTGSR